MLASGPRPAEARPPSAPNQARIAPSPTTSGRIGASRPPPWKRISERLDGRVERRRPKTVALPGGQFARFGKCEPLGERRQNGHVAHQGAGIHLFFIDAARGADPADAIEFVAPRRKGEIGARQTKRRLHALSRGGKPGHHEIERIAGPLVVPEAQVELRIDAGGRRVERGIGLLKQRRKDAAP